MKFSCWWRGLSEQDILIGNNPLKNVGCQEWDGHIM
jgi:succinate dehydrogenase flavin-adding protein (antitoxin of CptAB toxin-antitoxin module)